MKKTVACILAFVLWAGVAVSAQATTFLFDEETAGGICHWSRALMLYVYNAYSPLKQFEAVSAFVTYYTDRAVAPGYTEHGLTNSFQMNLGGHTAADTAVIDHGAVGYDQSVLGRIALYGGDTTILDTFVRDSKLSASQFFYSGTDYRDGANQVIQDGPFKIMRISGFGEDGWWNTWDWGVDTGAAGSLALYATEAYQKLSNADYLGFARLMCDYLLRLQDTDGGIRAGPIGMWSAEGDHQTYFWKLKSTEQNERALYGFEALYGLTGESKYGTAAAAVRSWLKGMYDPAVNLYHSSASYNGAAWTPADFGYIATDVMAFAPIETMFLDSFYGATQAERDAAVDRMFQAIEARTGIYDSGELKLFRFTAYGQAGGAASTYGSVEWSAQMAEAYLRTARVYSDRKDWAKTTEYLNKYHHLMRSLQGYFVIPGGDPDSLLAPYATYVDGSVAGNVPTGTGYTTYNCQGALASSYYALVRLMGLDPDMPKLLDDGVVVVHFASGTIRFRYSPVPDAEGFVYVEYIDENRSGQGYGRISKALRAVPQNGVLSCAYTYYADADGRLQYRKNYSDAGWTRLVSSIGYYNDAAGRRVTLSLATPDAAGNYYYHYQNEDWNGQGYGRVDYSKRRTALNGELSHKYYYYADANGRLQSKNGYATAALGTKVSTTTYYNDAANRMIGITLVTPDASGVTYYHYINEDWNGRGYGRVDQTKRQTALNGELSHKYYFYTDATGRLKQKNGYATSSFGTPVSYSTYYNDVANRMGALTLMTPDASGFVYYHYLNEDWGGAGRGRVSMTKRQVALDGALSHTYYYFADATGRLRSVNNYATAAFGTKISTATYNNDASNRMASLTLVTADAAGIIYYRYLNENWSGTGRGRVDKARRIVADDDGALSYSYSYHAGTNTVRYRYCYQTGSWTTLVATYEYDSFGTPIRKILPDGTVIDLSRQRGDSEVGDRLANLPSYPKTGSVLYTQTGEMAGEQSSESLPNNR